MAHRQASPQRLTVIGLRQDGLHRLLGAEREVEDVGQVPGAEPGVHHLGRHTQLQVVTLRVDDLSRSAVLELLQGRESTRPER